jgi:hypothetical protein
LKLFTDMGAFLQAFGDQKWLRGMQLISVINLEKNCVVVAKRSFIKGAL